MEKYIFAMAVVALLGSAAVAAQNENLLANSPGTAVAPAKKSPLAGQQNMDSRDAAKSKGVTRQEKLKSMQPGDNGDKTLRPAVNKTIEK